MNRERPRPLHWPFRNDMPEPAWLDRLADAELQLGHVAQAERLAARAAELREARS
jgi:hypothetical protein